MSPDCVAAHLVAGRLAMLLHRIDEATRHFNEALRLSPRVHIQKELGWIALQRGDVARAISLLTDHLAREAADFEAHNLLLECFYASGHYATAEEMARIAMESDAPSDCFRNNRFLCRLLQGASARSELETDPVKITNPFIRLNLRVATEIPASWDAERGAQLKTKLIFQAYRFGLPSAGAGRNELSIDRDGKRSSFLDPLVDVGKLNANTVRISDSSVSRRHAVLLNYPADVWIVDLGSTRGTRLDGARVSFRAHLDGVHELAFGDSKATVSARKGLLV